MANAPSVLHKLTKEQHGALLSWIAEGLTFREINQMGAGFEPPFSISSQLLYQYRRNYGADIRRLWQEHDDEAIHTGLAIRAKRIAALVKLASMLEEDLYEKHRLWLQDVKGIGAGENYERVTFELFNEAEIRQLRGVYDDIAKETGGRVTRADVTSFGQQIKGYVIVSPDEWDAETTE